MRDSEFPENVSKWRRHSKRRKIAIACQGGGSHTAFAAGVLRGLLTADCAEEKFRYGEDFVITALTGTSGGAICAGIAWASLLRHEDPRTVNVPNEQRRGRDAARHLREFWMDMACANLGTDAESDCEMPKDWYDWMDSIGNYGGVTAARRFPLVEGLCKIVADAACDRMRTLFRRHIQEIGSHADLCNPVLRLGATNILQGYSKPLGAEEPCFDLYDAMLASASIPPLYGPLPYRGEYFWDGLFSHNPPIDCLTNLKGHAKRMSPDEIWVIQINPVVCKRVPRSMRDLVDRRNELTGNLVMMSELYHIDVINRVLANDWGCEPEPKKLKPATIADLKHYGWRPIVLRVLQLDENLDFASKYERSSGHIERLMNLGEQRAKEFIQNQSIWTCEKSGEHWASTVNAKGKAPNPPKGCPNTMCPAAVLCNSVPLYRRGLVSAYKFAQALDSEASQPRG